jgi:hypothetical protein
VKRATSSGFADSAAVVLASAWTAHRLLLWNSYLASGQLDLKLHPDNRGLPLDFAGFRMP